MSDQGMQVPSLESRPTTTGFEWLWQAYIDLGTCRGIWMDVGPIPWTAIHEYGRSLGLLAEEMYVLHRVIRNLDNEWAKLRKARAEREKKTKRATPRAGAHRRGRR